VPWTEGAAIVDEWPDSRLVTTRGLGHSDVVRTPAVVAQAVEFLSVGAGAIVRPTTPGTRESHGIEQELFHREWRTPRPRASA
jgi:hypothetical protein